MTSFRYPAALAVAAVLTLIGSLPLAGQGGWLVLIPLLPLAVAIWAWQAGTDVNKYGIRVRALIGRRVIPWEDIAALVPDQRGRAVAALNDGSTVPLTAVKPADLPRIIAASGKAADNA